MIPVASLTARPSILYRLYDEAGELLYIGYTRCFPCRLDQHRGATPGQVGSVPGAADIQARLAYYTTEEYPSPAEAHAAERVAIRDEAPLFNRRYNVKRWRPAMRQGGWQPIEVSSA